MSTRRKTKPLTGALAATDELTADHLSERLLSTAETARFLGLSEATVTKLVGLGELRSFKVQRKRRFSVERHLVPFLKIREE